MPAIFNAKITVLLIVHKICEYFIPFDEFPASDPSDLFLISLKADLKVPAGNDPLLEEWIVYLTGTFRFSESKAKFI